MNSGNKIKQPIYIIAIAIILLLASSFINIDYEISALRIHTIDLLSDIRTESTDELNENVINEPSYLIKAGFNFTDGFHAINNFFIAEADKIISSGSNNSSQGVKTSLIGNTKQLSYFYSALKTAKTKGLRIAHFGDSAIEGDLITADIREALQSKFGGNGVGWLGIVSQDISFRLTTKHSFSDNWESAALYNSNPKGLPLGISGEIAVPKGNAWVKYETTRSRRYLKDFTVVKVYYSNAKNSKINYVFDNGTKQSAQLKQGSGIQELVLKSTSKAKSIKLEFPIIDQAYFYGVSLENEPGVYIDNFPLRGNSGVDLGQLKASILKDFAKYFDYDLIILEFGLNIAGSRKTDYTWYEREMVKVINHIKSVFPKTSIVMISVHDKAMKKGSSFVTDPTILKLLDAQKNIAKQADVAIWSMFDAMGGENSMPKWVNANPPMAFKDYIHFNDQGAARIAELFTEALLENYR